jgi:RNA 2',3'-cyclic 3'-phosphodiesterase
VSEEQRLRLFIALDLPEGWKSAVATAQEELRARIEKRLDQPVRLRWVRPEGIHLTLKFLGETPASRLDALQHALRQAVPQPPRFSLTLGRYGSFVERRPPRVILATVDGDHKALFALVERIETWLAAAGWPRERRGFAPHLTLARLPDALSNDTRYAIAHLANGLSVPLLPAWSIESVSLMQSHLSPGGARYERLQTFPN